MNDAAALAEHIRSLSDFEIVGETSEPYRHMGATLTEAVFQAGLHYESVVGPRVRKVLISHPSANTSSAFLALLREKGGASLLTWKKGARKLDTLQSLTEFFVAAGVESEDDLLLWLATPANLDLLSEIKGVGPKTIDCLKLLTGMPAVAVDVHLRRFLDEAGVRAPGYEAAKEVFTRAAEILGLSLTVLDLSIWQHMYRRADRARTAPPTGSG